MRVRDSRFFSIFIFSFPSVPLLPPIYASSALCLFLSTSKKILLQRCVSSWLVLEHARQHHVLVFTVQKIWCDIDLFCLQYCTGGQCRNTLGSFTCVCPPGTRYEPDEQICRDIDECEGEVIFITKDYDRGDIPPMFPQIAGYAPLWPRST